jgi:hypothetical protein
MKFAIVVGFAQEAAIVGNPDNAVVIVGGGNAAKLASELNAAIDGGCDHVLSFGTWGALDPAIKAGEISVGWSLVGAGLTTSCDRAWASSLIAATGARAVVVTISATTVATAADKAALRVQTGADVVDFETLVAARVAWNRGVKFAALRAASDTADQDIPPAALKALGAGGGLDVGAVIGSLFGDLRELPALERLDTSSRAAFDALPRALADIGINFEAP